MQKNDRPEKVMAGPFQPYTDREAGFLDGAVYRPMPCRCTVTGNGTLPHPLTPVLCEKHASAPELLEALKMAEVHLGWGDCSLDNVHRICRAAIAKAEGRPE